MRTLRFESLEDRSLLALLAPVDYSDTLADAAIGDVNGDGSADVVGFGSGSLAGQLAVRLGGGDGTLADPLLSPLRPGAASIELGDLNGDGALDLISAHIGELRMHQGRGDGTFEPSTMIASLPSGSFPVQYAVADLDNDGDLDLVGRSLLLTSTGSLFPSTSAFLHPLANDGSGSFTALPTFPGGTSGFFLADFTGDGAPDLLVRNAGQFGVAASTSLSLGNGDGTFQLSVSVASLHGATAVTDFNGDGHLDFVGVKATINANPVVEWQAFLGNGGGTFQAGPLDVPSGPFADFNSDGLADYYAAHATSGSLVVRLSHGNATFDSPRSFPAGAGATVPIVGDLNGDGLLDAAVLNSEGFSVLRNDGDWTLPPPLPSVSIRDVTVIEGNTGTAAAIFTVTLSAACGEPVSVSYATANGTATAGNDYQPSSGRLTIPAGQTTGTIIVLASGDRVAESNETFFVNLSSPAGAMIADGQGVGTIVDDEPRISISDVIKAEGKKGQTSLFTFTVTLSVAYDQPVTVSYQTVNGTASSGSGDYVAKTGTLSFAPGETTKAITIEVKGDRNREANESFYVDLFDNSSNSLLTKNRGIGTILNDD